LASCWKLGGNDNLHAAALLLLGYGSRASPL
jgi:hypothetical protein